MCGNANNIWELVAFRFIQGSGGALLVTAQTIITESYPVAKRGMAQAIYGMGVIVSYSWTAIRGYIVDHFSWPYIFYINIPIGIMPHLTLSFVKVQSMEINSRAKSIGGVSFTNCLYWFFTIYFRTRTTR
jgi:DHA2 family multidrug resistance protein